PKRRAAHRSSPRACRARLPRRIHASRSARHRCCERPGQPFRLRRGLARTQEPPRRGARSPALRGCGLTQPPPDGRSSHMKRKPRLFIAACALALTIGGAPARAQWVVIDPANLAQSITQVTHMISQINNQIEQIRQQAQMLQSLDLQLSPELSASIQEARALLTEAEGLRQNA